MYVTIKLDGNVSTIHSINVDGKEIMPDFRYNITRHKFVHHGSEGFGLREAVDKILNQKKENEESEISENKELERRKREREESKRSMKNNMKNT